MKKMKKTRVLVFIALFIAIEIVLTRFLSIQTPIIRISFGFIPIALSAIMFGPIVGGVTAMLADLLGMMLFPRFAYFPGFTLSALLGGITYGLFLYKKPNSIWRIALTVLTISVFIDLGLNTIWVTMMAVKVPFWTAWRDLEINTFWNTLVSNNASMPILISRLIKTTIMLPVQVFLIHIVWRYVGPIIQKRVRNGE